MWPFIGFMGAYGVLSCVFAFVEPPRAVSGLFKVPSIFVFLPERYVMRAGRLFMGVLCLALMGFFAVELSKAPAAPELPPMPTMPTMPTAPTP